MQNTSDASHVAGVDAFTLLHKDPNQPCHGKTFYGAFREHKARLDAYNELGYNVFFTVNLTDGLGRRAENIVKARSLFADFDNGLPKQFVLEPSLVVQSSPGKYQAYWTIEGWTTDLARWGRIERAMVKALGADPNAQDLARVFRVPGFLNHKYATPYRTTVYLATSKCYNLDSAALAFGEDFSAQASHGGRGGVVPADLPPMEERVYRYGAWLAKCLKSGWPTSGRNGLLFNWACQGVMNFACEPGEVEELLHAAWDLHDTSGDDPRIESIVANAERSASGVLGSAYAAPEFVFADDEPDVNALEREHAIGDLIRE